MAGVSKCVLEVSPGPMDSVWFKLARQLALVIRGGTSVSVGYLWAGDETELVLLSESIRTVVGKCDAKSVAGISCEKLILFLMRHVLRL